MDASWAVGVAGSTTEPRSICFFNWNLRRRDGGEKSQTSERERERERERVGRREAGSPQREGRGHTLRQREATSKTMTASHTNHQRAYCSANYCTSQSQENDKNQQWMCLCWGNIRGTPLSFLISSFLFLSLSLSFSFTFPLSPFFLAPPPPPHLFIFLL